MPSLRRITTTHFFVVKQNFCAQVASAQLVETEGHLKIWLKLIENKFKANKIREMQSALFEFDGDRITAVY